jgi:hypothetical protein
VGSPEEQARIHLRLQPWAPGRNEVFVRLPLKVVTGRRISAPGESDLENSAVKT